MFEKCNINKVRFDLMSSITHYGHLKRHSKVFTIMGHSEMFENQKPIAVLHTWVTGLTSLCMCVSAEVQVPG